MAAKDRFTLRWGIMATGAIADLFARDLLKDPSTRDVQDVAHIVQAVAASSSLEKAQKFASDITEGKPHSITSYGSYKELVEDPNVDIIYVATPHSHHYECALLALRAGKHVCCEKPFTINAGQTKHLITLARERSLFLMEAVWTRFFPLSIALQRMLFEDKILGKIHRVFADFGLPFDIHNISREHRLLNPGLGGGALLDLGIYSLTWVMMTCFQNPENQGARPVVNGSMLKTPLTGVDEFTNVSLLFPKIRVSAVATTNMTVRSPDTFARIQGDKGDITVQWSPFRPESLTLELIGQAPRKIPFHIPGHGMFWEADACARAIRDGKQEADRCTLAESLMVMEIMDEIRKQNDLVYPDKLEYFQEY